MSTTEAAILVELAQPLVVDTLEVPTLQAGQVLVDMAFSGVCHTQLLEVRGYRGPDRFLPHLLGHEGSGRVRSTGAGVTRVEPGDAVIVSWIKAGGAEFLGTRYRWAGQSVNAGPVTTFGRASVVSENRLTRMPDGVGLREGALLGCALATGLGAIVNVAQVRPGQSVVVFGAGGIGLSAIGGAALAGATPIVAVDVQPAKLAFARAMGATETILPSSDGALPALRSLLPGGFDVAIEATGRPSVMAEALASVHAQGGAAVIIGNARNGELLQIDPRELNQGKRLLGTWGGDNVPDRDFPRYARLVAAGRLRLEILIGQSYPLADIDLALSALEGGQVARPMIDMSL
jgi:S-(hydroxymethyl)glutathione dehydrogenase / alcohol dehydrogenase